MLFMASIRAGAYDALIDEAASSGVFRRLLALGGDGIFSLRR